MAPRDKNLSLSSEQSDQSYQSSRSASALGHRPTAEMSPYYQLPIPTLQVPSSSDVEDDYVYNISSQSQNYIARSRTPTNDYENDVKVGMGMSRIGSLDGSEYGEGEFGSPLYRVSTAPSAARLPPAQAQGRSAKKLSKMGISVADQVVRNAVPPQTSTHGGRRFGAFRSLFKSKS